jgi:hypothetical protein
MERQHVAKAQRRQFATRRVGLVGLGIVVLLGILALGLGLYAYSQLSSARDDLNRATIDATELQGSLTAGDQARATTELTELQRNVHSASSTLDSSVLSLATKVPFFGKNITAVRTIASAAETVADEGLPPLVDVADQFNAETFNPQGGRVDIDALTALTPNLTAASAAIDDANAEIQSVEVSSLLGQLQDPVADAQEKIADAADIAQRATKASGILPKLLDGKHTYLLVFQNNAEIRATGGLPGAYAQLNVDNGSIELGAQGAGGEFGDLTAPAAPLSAEENQLFTELLVTDFRDVNFTPNFPRAAQLASTIFLQEKGVDVDGVLSLDPVTLSYLLKAIGPIELADGTRVTSENAVEVLLNGVYVNYPEGADQDALFASAAKKVFDRILSGAGDPTALLTALSTATAERRVSFWSKNADVAAELAGTPLAHELPTGDSASPAIGFYLNDATGAKMQYYLNYSVAGKSTKCTPDGKQSYISEMTLQSTAPADSASLPESIRGPGFGADPGSMLVNLYLYGTDAGTINTVTIDNEETTFTRGTHEGRPVVILTIQLDPGQTVTVQSTLTSGPGQEGSTAITQTPSIRPGPSTQTWKSSC